ncbi:hypothetical protein QLQ12_34675 [Actinoplanes sp. NEAU-A12]|uniref:Uncharacterized protein n=1 Tax=Actinoplanes sandaracinus TaxID=3045177 RepID=A0ABT6WVJ7_9ACTN|nr:hypothetical protein [Actinoplanes sandaracinus]MDI6103772.1 hypothetical protein [Actinoplanes sandaracinus]
MLLGRQGRLDEVFTLLQPYLTEWFLVSALVEATADGDRDERVINLLEDLVKAMERQPEGWRGEPQNAAQSLVTVLERQGRRVRRGPVNEIKQLADLLPKDGRESELRDLVAGEGLDLATSGSGVAADGREC